jgi:hypothetical protein
MFCGHAESQVESTLYLQEGLFAIAHSLAFYAAWSIDSSFSEAARATYECEAMTYFVTLLLVMTKALP